MSCSSSVPTRLLATKTSKLEKKDVPGGANTTPSKPRGNSSTVDLFSLLTAGVDEAASTGSGSIGSKAFAGPPAPELPTPSTDGGGGTTSTPAPESEPNLLSPAELPEL